MTRYKKAKDGEWIKPVRRGYKMQCCDCGLVHVIDFKLIPWAAGKKVIFRARRDERATAACRRSKPK